MNEENINNENEIGVVIQVSQGEILVECESLKMCMGCAAKGSCMMSDDDSNKKRLIWMDNNIVAAPGDVISFIIDAKGVVFASIILYLVPVVFLFIGLYLGYRFYSQVGMEQDGASALGGFFFLSISFFAVRLLSKINSQKTIFKPQALKKLERS